MVIPETLHARSNKVRWMDYELTLRGGQEMHRCINRAHRSMHYINLHDGGSPFSWLPVTISLTQDDKFVGQWQTVLSGASRADPVICYILKLHEMSLRRWFPGCEVPLLPSETLLYNV